MRDFPATELIKVTKTFLAPDGRSRIEALSGVTLTLPPDARLVALIGPDGAGKSTLMRLLCGLEAPDEGEVRTLGAAPDPDDPAAIRRIAFMPQRLGLYAELSCAENLLLSARLAGLAPEEDRRKCEELLALVGLAPFAARPAGKLSGGMKQKLALAGALLASPELLLLDEPTVGVDPLSRRELWTALRARLETEHFTCLFSTAYLEEAETADHVILLEEGRLIASGSPADFIARARGRTFFVEAPKKEEGAAAPEDPSRELMLRVRTADPGSPWLDAVPRGGRTDLLLAGEPGGAVPPPTAAGLAVHPRPPRLEDAYALLTFGGAGRREAAAETEADANAPGAAVRNDAAERPVVVSTKGVRRTFGSFVAVDDTTFDVRAGEIFGILGPNGAGKTTTFRMLCSLLPMSAGEIRVAGHDLAVAKSAARASLGYVAQKFSLYGRLSVRENLVFFGRSYGLFGKELRRRVDEHLEEFDLCQDSSSASRSSR